MTPPRARAPRRILVGLGETAGYCAQLANGFRALGLHADHLNLADDPFGYGETPGVRVRLVRWLTARRRRGPGPRAAWRLVHRAAMLLLLLESIVRYDAFVLRAGDSFLGLRDLWLLRRIGMPVVVVFFGSDSRPSYLNGGEVLRGITGGRAAAVTAAKRRIVERTERHASAIVCHTMSAQLHARSAFAFLEVGLPRASGAIDPAAAQPAGGRAIRVLHAPSRPADKGTDVIRAAVVAARERGADVDLEVMTGRPNRDVLAALAQCDFVIDQAYSDTPLGGFAAEAAAHGRPAIVGGYAWGELRRVTSPDALPPSFLCRPEELADAVVRLATDEHLRRRLGDAARQFVAGRWSAVAVAQRMLAILEGTAPASWQFDPSQIRYLHGVGISEGEVQAAIATVLDQEGPDGLQLPHRPDLERDLVALAGSGVPREPSP